MIGLATEMIEPFTGKYLDAVVDLHYKSLTGLLRDLGPRAIRAFYTGAIDSESAIAFVVTEHGALRGFVFGSDHPELLKRDVLKNNFFQVFLGICLGVVCKPSTLVSLWSTGKDSKDRDYDTRVAELTYLAVDEESRTAGLGRRLVERFGQALGERGISAYELSVDADNAAAIDFYQRMKFQPLGEYREFGVNHIRYRMDMS